MKEYVVRENLQPSMLIRHIKYTSLIPDGRIVGYAKRTNIYKNELWFSILYFMKKFGTTMRSQLFISHTTSRFIYTLKNVDSLLNIIL